MGMGSSNPATLKLPQAPGAAPDMLDADVIRKRQAALRAIAAKQGLQSTFLTTPSVGAAPLLSGNGGS